MVLTVILQIIILAILLRYPRLYFMPKLIFQAWENAIFVRKTSLHKIQIKTGRSPLFSFFLHFEFLILYIEIVFSSPMSSMVLEWLCSAYLTQISLLTMQCMISITKLYLFQGPIVTRHVLNSWRRHIL